MSDRPFVPVAMSNGSRYLPYNANGIPDDLKAHPHWLVCNQKGRPVSRVGVGNSKTNPDDWTDFETVSRLCHKEEGLYPYIVLTDKTFITVFDIDFNHSVRDESYQDLEARERRANESLEELRRSFPNRYEEVSKSGGGIHIIVEGKFEGAGGKGKGDWSEVEVYTRGHGIALTGHVLGEHSDIWFPGNDLIQKCRDAIKGNAGEGQRLEGKQGSVRIEFAREVAAELAMKLGRPSYPIWRDLSSAFFDGVGVAAGIELLREVFPEEGKGEYEALARSLAKFIPWDTLRVHGVETTDPETLLDGFDCLELEEIQANPVSSIIRGVNSFPVDPPAEDILLGAGWLRRGDIGFLVSSAGAGKSVWTIQAGIAWALGRPYSGIAPTRPLRILHFIGEDDDSTFGQCREGLIEHAFECMGFSPSKEDLERLDCTMRTDLCRLRAGNTFLGRLDSLLTEEPADLVIINPLLAYVGGDIVSEGPLFLRNGLMPILQKHRCAAWIAHHTCKQNRESWKTTDLTYAAIGGGEMANIPRTSLVLTPTNVEGLNRLVVTKRQTTGWKDEDGNFRTEFFIRRSLSPTRPAWLPVSYSEAANEKGTAKSEARQSKSSVEDVLALLENGPRPQSEVVRSIMGQAKCGESTAKRVIAEARNCGFITVRQKRNPRGGREIFELKLSDTLAKEWDSLDDDL